MDQPRPFRRRVLYIPGYDPIPPRRYRELFRREGADQAAISGYHLAMAERADRTGFGWGATGDIGGPAQVEFEVLVWSDIVQSSMGRGIAATYGQLFRTAWAYIGSGALWRLMRLRRGPVLAALYPIAVLLMQALIAALVAGAGFWAASLLLPWPLALILAAALFYAGLWLWRRADGRIFAYYLMHDYAFTAQDGGAYPPALEQRIASFSDRLADVLADDWDEVLLVGHSSGAYLAVSVMTDLLRSGRGGAPGRAVADDAGPCRADGGLPAARRPAARRSGRAFGAAGRLLAGCHGTGRCLQLWAMRSGGDRRGCAAGSALAAGDQRGLYPDPVAREIADAARALVPAAFPVSLRFRPARPL